MALGAPTGAAGTNDGQECGAGAADIAAVGVLRDADLRLRCGDGRGQLAAFRGLREEVLYRYELRICVHSLRKGGLPAILSSLLRVVPLRLVDAPLVEASGAGRAFVERRAGNRIGCLPGTVATMDCGDA